MDYSDAIKIQQRMDTALKEIKRRTGAVGTARQISNHKFNEVMLKSIKAKYFVAVRPTVKSDTMADEAAMTDPKYLEEVAAHAKAYQRACELVNEWDYWMAQYEASRSLLSMLKTQVGLQ